jgi:hypothetical protein
VIPSAGSNTRREFVRLVWPPHVWRPWRIHWSYAVCIYGRRSHWLEISENVRISVESHIFAPRTSILATSARDILSSGRNLPFCPDTIPFVVAYSTTLLYAEFSDTSVYVGAELADTGTVFPAARRSIVRNSPRVTRRSVVIRSVHCLSSVG